MRPALPLPGALLATLLSCSACSSSSSPASIVDASTASPPQDGSTAPCTSQGGTCMPYTSSCPVLQQNAALCGDSVLLCCLPPYDAATFVPESGAPDGGGSGDATSGDGGTESGSDGGPGDSATESSTDAPAG